MIGLGASIEVVSDGIEQGIARILSRNYVTLLPILANRLRQVDQNSWRIDFPYSSDACRAASGNCKCKSTPRNKRVLVIGDGKSDMRVASTADFVFAKAASPSTARPTTSLTRASTPSPKCLRCWPDCLRASPPTLPPSSLLILGSFHYV